MFGIIALIIFLTLLYLISNRVHWQYARHYRPKFRWMRWCDFVESWDCLNFSNHRLFYRILIVFIVIIGIAMCVFIEFII